MGLCDELNNITPEKIFFNALKVDTGNWDHVFSACLGKMMVIQNACSEIVVQEEDWGVDFSEGIISFGNNKYPLQFIGSESTYSQTWLWGWDNVNSFSEKIVSIAQQVKEIGEQWQLEPLTTAQLDLNSTFNGHNLSIVVCGLLDQYCYYRGPHADGAIFVAFSGVPKEVFVPIDSLKFTSLTMQCIEQCHIDHSIFVESFLLWNGTKYEWHDHTIIADFQHELHIKFARVDDLLRISSIRTQ